MSDVLVIQCGRPDPKDRRRYVAAEMGQRKHEDRFDTDSDFHRQKFRQRVISKFGLPDEGDVHADIEDKIGRAAEAIDSEQIVPLNKPQVVSLADIEEKPVDWFWPGYMPAGAVTLLDGDPNEGKSTIALDLAARYSRGDAMPPHAAPDATYQSGDVLLIQGEDDPQRTTKPRLVAAGARVERVHLLRTVIIDGDDERFIQLPLDIPIVEQVIVEKTIGLVVVDVLSAFTEEKVSMNDDAAMRRLFTPLAASAERTQAAFLVLRHLNKKEGTRSMYRGGGSIAIVGAARAAFAVAPNPDDPSEKVFVPLKHNLGPRPHSLTYRIEACGDTSRIVWGGQTELTAADVLKSERRGGGNQNKLDVAKEIIAEILSSGPRGSNEVETACREAGISVRTCKAARKALGVRAEKIEFGGQWMLTLPSMNGVAHHDDF